MVDMKDKLIGDIWFADECRKRFYGYTEQEIKDICQQLRQEEK